MLRYNAGGGRSPLPYDYNQAKTASTLGMFVCLIAL